MPNKNLVILVGHLGADPEMQYSSGGTAICNFSLATSWGKKKDDGTWDNFTDWHKVVCFKNVAEKVAEKAQKGHAVMVTGTIRYESWEKDGEKKYMTKIIGNQVDILSAGFTESPTGAKEPPPKDDPTKDKPKDAADKAKTTREAQAATTEEEPDDLPF